MKDIKTIALKKGVNLHFVNTDKFKTNYLGFSFHRPLSKQESTVNSLLANILCRGCKDYPDTAALQRRLEELFGAELITGVKKKGDMQLVCVNFEFANEAYIGSKQPVFEDVCNLAEQVVFGQIGFNPIYVEQEKENLKNQILAIINDKREYAQVRLIEEMCKQEPYGIMELGNVELLSDINADQLFGHYKNVLLKSAMDIFVVGKIDVDAVTKRIEKMTDALEPYNGEPFHNVIVKEVADVKTITQKEQINQAKLAMGFRTKTEGIDSDYDALVVCNAIFGGGPYSKLFNNVREKMSLAYYVFSRLDKFKGIMLVNSGIEIQNFQVAFDGIIDQVKAVKKGDFSNEDLMAAKLGMINAIRSVGDSQRLIEDYYIGEMLCGRQAGIDEFADAIMNVKAEQVINVAQKIQLDTVYFLTSESFDK